MKYNSLLTVFLYPFEPDAAQRVHKYTLGNFRIYTAVNGKILHTLEPITFVTEHRIIAQWELLSKIC